MKPSATARKGSVPGREGGRLRPGHAALVVGFAFGVAFGLTLGAVAYFMNLEAVPGGILAYGIQLTGHPDIPEDLVWFLSGGFIGAMVAALAAWRAEKRRADGIGKEHVLNRTFRVLEGGQATGSREMPSPGGTSEGRERT